MCVVGGDSSPPIFVQGTAVKNFKRRVNAAIKPKAIAVATEVQRAKVENGSLLTTFQTRTLRVLCTATDIAEA